MFHCSLSLPHFQPTPPFLLSRPSNLFRCCYQWTHLTYLQIHLIYPTPAMHCYTAIMLWFCPCFISVLSFHIMSAEDIVDIHAPMDDLNVSAEMDRSTLGLSATSPPTSTDMSFSSNLGMKSNSPAPNLPSLSAPVSCGDFTYFPVWVPIKNKSSLCPPTSIPSTKTLPVSLSTPNDQSFSVTAASEMVQIPPKLCYDSSHLPPMKVVSTEYLDSLPSLTMEESYNFLLSALSSYRKPE